MQIKQFAQSLLCISLLLSGSTATAKKCCNKNRNKWDYIIVGGGTTGAVIAAKLSDPVNGKYKNSVLVIEAGENLSNDPRVVDANNIIAAVAEEHDPALSNVIMTYPLGQSVNPFYWYAYTQGIQWGGSSGHNYLQCIRGTPDELNEWAVLSGDSRWSYNSLLNTAIKPLETYTPNGSVANPTQRGSTGPLFISQESYPTLANDAFYQAVATAAGVPIVQDYNDPDEGILGVSPCQDYVTPPLGVTSKRSYSCNAYLTGEAGFGVPAIVDVDGNGLNGRKIKVLSNAYANRVLFSKNKTANAVEYVMADAPEAIVIAKARKGIVLCTGGVSDPAMLERSGIGDPAVLEPLGIPVVYANTNVGNNMLCDVGQQGIIGDVTTDVDLPSTGFAFVGFEPTPAERQYYLTIANGLLAFPQGISNALGITTGISVIGTNLTCKSTGSVHIISKDPFTQPLVNFNFFSDGSTTEPGSDANKVIQFYNLLQDIAAEAGGTVLYPTPAQYAGGDADLMAAALGTLLPYNHITATCKMAQSAATGVIDGSLRVFGVQNLYVASAASEPSIVGGQEVCMMLGLQAARIIRGEA